MQHNGSSVSLRWRLTLLVFVMSIGVATVFSISSTARMANRVDPQQDVIRLENRVTQLEQRLYSMETNIRTLEQQLRVAGVSSRDVNHEQLRLLDSGLQMLQRKIVDHECALAKLDERTLPAEVRNTRRRAAGGATDPCRTNVDTPLRFSTSPE